VPLVLNSSLILAHIERRVELLINDVQLRTGMISVAPLWASHTDLPDRALVGGPFAARHREWRRSMLEGEEALLQDTLKTSFSFDNGLRLC
jgi:hypothetical protein